MDNSFLVFRGPFIYWPLWYPDKWRLSIPEPAEHEKKGILAEFLKVRQV
jgi:hypothetical protein